MAQTPAAIAVPVSVGVGVALAAGRLAASFVANPTGPRYMARYAAHTPTLRRADDPVAVSAPAADAVEHLAALGFGAPITLVGDDGDALLHVVPAREDRVCAVVTDATGSVTVHSRLVDGRIVTTASGLVAPSDELVVNPCDVGGVAAVVRRHAQVLRLMFETRLAADDPVSLAVAALAAERRAWSGVRRRRSAFAHVAGRRGLVRVHAAVPDAALLLHSALAVPTAGVPDTVTLTDTIDLTDAVGMNAAADLPAAAPRRRDRGESPTRPPLLLWEDPPSVPRGGGLRELEPQGV